MEAHKLIGKYVKAIGNCGMAKDMPVYGILKRDTEFGNDVSGMLTVNTKHYIASVYAHTIEPAPAIEYHREPTKAEIKFGEGATHYKEFEASEYLNDKGKIKEWLICPIDKLRYYR